MLHSKIKDLLLTKVPNITKFLKDMELPLSYLGIRYFLSGKQDKIGEKGMDKIIDKLGYEMILVPVKSEEDKIKAIELQDKFVADFDQYLDKFKDDRKTTRRTSENSGPMAIEGILTDLDTSKPSLDTGTGIAIDLGITAEDLF
jgi:hypothetical protein